jgi:hypothetical protein
MSSTRPTAVVAGVFFVGAAIASIPALALSQPVLGDADDLLGTGADPQVLLGAFLEVITVVAAIGIGSRCIRWSRGRTTASPWAMSAVACWKPRSSPSESSAFSRW